jgi:hypothetical protein
MAEAPVLEALFNDYAAQGLLIMTLLAGTDEAGVQTWVEEYGLTHPVLNDASGAVANRWEADYAWPSKTLLAGGLELLVADGEVSEIDIEEALSE